MGLLFFTGGCATQSLLPTQGVYTESSFETYTQVEGVVENIEIGKTKYSDLVKLGLDLENIPNVKRLTYLDVMSKFKLDSPSRYTLFNKIELPSGVLKTLAAREDGLAYEINLERIKNQREGSVILDILNFRKNVHTTGWKISVLILMVDDTVEYVLYSGEKNIDTLKRERNPLGPFQGFDGGDIIGAASDLK
jgi:hypothetical protein|tara:strand:+ start:211 stop:789 length:579 start_codon:yes stop_codon:yes gene_type:complete